MDTGSEARPPRRLPIREGVVLAVALLIGLAVWLIVRDGGSSSSAPTQPRAGATAVSLSELRALASSSERPIYWAGPRPGSTYELTRTSDGRTYVRYLPSGTAVGTNRPYLTIGTYSLPNAYAASRALASADSAVKVPIGGGGIAFYDKKSPTNVYFAFPGAAYQVEVYDPSAAEARTLVSGRHVTPVSAAAGEAPATAVSAARLRAFAASLAHPLYWAGSRAGTTYELTRASGGRIFVRYLPRGVAVGSGKPYLTVGTYPLQNALTITRSLARRPGSVRVPTAGGGVAFYSRKRPTNVYLAYPGLNVQVEVYDPSAARARLVASRSIAPVG